MWPDTRILDSMVLFTPHYLLQFGGSIGASNEEIWSCGIRMHSSLYQGFDETGWFNGVGKTAPADWIARPGSRIASHCKLRFVKFNFINEAGHYDDPANTREWIYPTPVAGGGGTGNNPWQCSVVLGWRTNAATRGRASKGRIYSPCPSMTIIGSTGRITPTDAAAISTSAALFLNTLDAGFGTAQTIRPHIMSGVDGSFNEINTVVVDDRVDIQRRRAENIVPVEYPTSVLY